MPLGQYPYRDMVSDWPPVSEKKEPQLYPRVILQTKKYRVVVLEGHIDEHGQHAREVRLESLCADALGEEYWCDIHLGSKDLRFHFARLILQLNEEQDLRG